MLCNNYCEGTPFSLCEYSPHAVHWIVDLPVPKFLDMKSFLGQTDDPVDGSGWGGASEVDFLPFLPLFDVFSFG